MTLYGVSDGFEEWYPEAHGRVLATMLLVSGSLDAAAEATDEAFCRAFVKWRTVSETTSPVAWTIRVAINVTRRRARRAGLEARLLRRQPPADLVPAPAGEAWDAVKDLPERQRQVLVLRYVADLSEAEIARILGVSRSSISTSLTAARRNAAQLLCDPINP